MKKLLLMTMAIIISTTMIAQVQKLAIEAGIDKINTDTKQDPAMLVSYRTLDLFFAKKLAFYLSGSNDLSLFKNYAVLDFGEDKAKIGWNIDLSKPDGRISEIVTIGLQAAVSKNFAALFSDKKLNNDIGIDLKYTHIFRGSIWFDKYVQNQKNALAPLKKPQKLMMDLKRDLIRASLQVEIDKGYKEYQDYIAALTNGGVDATIVAKEESVKLKKLQEKILKLYYEQELDQLEDPENEAYNRSRIHWISFSGFIPVTKTSYTGTTSFLITPLDLVSRKWNVGVNYNSLIVLRQNKFYFNIGFNIFQNNSVDADKMEKLSLEEYKVLSMSGDTASVANLKRNDVYIGTYQTFWTPNLKGQFVYYPSWSPKVGIDLSLTKKFGKDQALDFVLGFPVTLTGKEENSPVNLILQLKMPDINNKNQPDVKWKDKLQAGFTVGLPFNSILK